MFMTSLSLYLALEYKKPLKTANVDKNVKSDANLTKKQNLKIDSVIDEYLDSDLDAGDDSSYEETQQFLQSLIDESYETSKLQNQSSDMKMKKIDYKRLMH